MKKTLAMVLAVMLAVLTFVPCAFAATVPDFSVRMCKGDYSATLPEPASVSPDTFTLIVKAPEIKNLVGFTAYFKFDTNVLSVAAITDGNDLAGAVGKYDEDENYIANFNGMWENGLRGGTTDEYSCGFISANGVSKSSAADMIYITFNVIDKDAASTDVKFYIDECLTEDANDSNEINSNTLVDTKTITFKNDPASGHVFGPWVVVKDPTYTAKGSRYAICEYCGETKYETTVKKLAAPKLTKIANVNGGVTINWAKSEGASGYYVYRKTTSGWSKIGTTTALTFTDKKAVSGTTYAYTVRGFNSIGAGLFNTTGLKIKYLAAPTVNVANVSAGVTVKWNKIAGAQGYYVYRKAGTGSYTKIATITRNSTVSYTDKNVKSGTAYRYIIKAYYGTTISAYTSPAAIKFLSCTKITSAISSKTGITLKYNRVAGASGYYIYRKTTGGWSKIATIKSGATLSYIDKGARKGTTYTYTIKSYSGSFYSANSNSVRLIDKY